MGFQMSYIKDMASDGTMSIMDGFCHHGYAHTPGNRDIISRYWNGNTTTDPMTTWPGLKTHGKPSWQTESADLPVDWSGAMSLARTIQDELVAGNLSGYVNWCYASDGASDTYALLVSTNVRTDKYFAMKHFSRYIRPGAKRLPCTPDVPGGLSVSAYRHAANGTLTVVMINAGTTEQTANVTLPAAPAAVSSFDVYTTRSGSRWVASTAAVSGNTVSVAVPASSFVTLYGQGQTMVKPESRAPHGAAPRCVRPALQVRRQMSQPQCVLVASADGQHDLRGRALIR